MDDTKNPALSPSGDNMSSPLTPAANPAPAPSFHSDMDVPPPPASSSDNLGGPSEPSGGLGTPVPAPFAPPVVHEEVEETPAMPTEPDAPVTHPPTDEHPAEPAATTNTAPPATTPGGNFGGLPPVITPPQKKSKGKMFAAIAAVVLLVISIPVGVILVRQNLELREKAAFSDEYGGGVGDDEGGSSVEVPTAAPAEPDTQPTDPPSSPNDPPAQPPAEPDDPGDGGGNGDDGGSGGNGEDNGAAQQDKLINDDCTVSECDTAIGKMVCIDTWQRPDGSTYPYAGSIKGDCQQDPPASGGSASLPDECAYPGQPSEEAGDSETANCGGHKYCHYEGSRLVWGTYQCNFCTNGATNPPNCNNNIGDCGNEGGVCVGSSGICQNQGGYTSDASCNGNGSCCMGAVGSPSAPSSPGSPESGTTGGTVAGTVGTGSCIATISFEGVNQAWRQPAGSPVTVCAPVSTSVSLTMVVTIPDNCPPQTVTWNETNATCTGTSYSMCPGPAGTPCSATPVQKAGQAVWGQPLRQTITTTSPSCGSTQIDIDKIAINGISTNYGEGIRAFQNNCGPNQCLAIKVYKYPYDAQYQVNNLSSLKPGDPVKFCLVATGGTPQLRINGGSPRVAQENGPDGSKCLQYDIPSDATTLRVTGEI